MILRLPKSDLRMRGGNAGRLSTEISAPVAGRISTSKNYPPPVTLLSVLSAVCIAQN